MDDVSKGLIGAQLLEQLCTSAEADELIALANSAKFINVERGASLLSMAQSIANNVGQKEKLLEIARTPHEEQDANLQLFGFIRDIIPKLIKEVSEKGRPEGDAKREFRERIGNFVKSMYPGADEATIALTIGQSFEDVPGKWTFNIGRCVLALRNLKRFG